MVKGSLGVSNLLLTIFIYKLESVIVYSYEIFLLWKSDLSLNRCYNADVNILHMGMNIDKFIKGYLKRGISVMLENQINALTRILRDEDIHKYDGDAFCNIIKAVYLGDIGALLDVGKDVKEIIFNIPAILFWDKMKRYMFGTFNDFSEQVKLAEKFNRRNKNYNEFVKKQIHLINEINDDKKVDYFAQLTRCYLLYEMEDALFYKLARFITLCTLEELEYISSFGYKATTVLTAKVSSLYQYGLFEQKEKESEGVDYVLSGFAKALKSDSLNFGDKTNKENPILTYDEIVPLSIPEPMNGEDLVSIFNSNEFVINGGGAY